MTTSPRAPIRDLLNAEQANAVYDVLVASAGASGHPEAKTDFVYLQTARHCEEYRFAGALGFGGKFWNCNGRWYVTAYPEDLTPGRARMIDAANAALAALREELA